MTLAAVVVTILVAFAGGVLVGLSAKQTGDVPRARLFTAGMLTFGTAVSLAMLVWTGVPS